MHSIFPKDIEISTLLEELRRRDQALVRQWLLSLTYPLAYSFSLTSPFISLTHSPTHPSWHAFAHSGEVYLAAARHADAGTGEGGQREG